MTKLLRRQALKSTAGALAAISMPATCGQVSSAIAADKPPVSAIIDTHTHFYDPSRPQGVPWPSKDDPLLYRPVFPAEYQLFAQPLGVTGTIVVEASPWAEDNQWVLDLAEKETFIVGLVGNLKPGEDEFSPLLERFSQNRLFRGIRISHSLMKTRLDQPAFLRDLKALTDHDLELDINGGADMLPDVARLAETLPTLRIVVNHCANVRIDGQSPPEPWQRDMRALQKHASVYCKVSGLVEGTGRRDGTAPSDVAFYKPTLDIIWNAFGEDRVIYGSNWPVSKRFASYDVVQRIVTDYFAEHGRQASEKYFHHNALAAYKPVQR